MRKLHLAAGVICLAAVAFMPAFSGPAQDRDPSGPGVGEEVLRDLAERGESRVVISLRPASPAPSSLRPRTQARQRMDEVLDSLPPGSWGEARRLITVPAASARITPGALSRLREDPRVSRIDRDGEIVGMETGPLAQIGADRVQALGFMGLGVTVAVLDSGTDPLSNADLDPALDGEECFCSGGGGCCPDGSARQSGPGSAASVTSHGTGVMGIVASRGVLAPPGVAPSARVLAVRVLDDGLSGSFSDILEALDWVLVNRRDVRLVNLSLAAGPFPPFCDHLNAFNEAVTQMSALLRERGGLMIAAAGNQFSLSQMGSPACISSVVAVGAVDGADQVMSFSNAAASLDLLAPGDRILTTGSFGRIISLTGTSAAAPHVTGAAALLLSAAPDLSAQELEDRLEEKGVPVVDGRTGASYPRLDVFRALVISVEAEPSPPVLSLRSRGRGFSVRVEPPPPFQAADLDPLSFTLRGAAGSPVPAEARGAELGDGDGDGIPDLLLYFDRRSVTSGIPAAGSAALTLEGRFVSGPDCLGKFSLRLVGTGGHVPANEPRP